MMNSNVVMELIDAVVRYPGRGARSVPVNALDGVSLELARGRILGLAGPNGAGKTTLLEVCIAALSLSAGQVRWFGDSTLSARSRRRIGFAPDVPELPARLTAREALELFASLDGIPRTHARQAIADLSARLGVDEALDRRVETLSRGTAQRIGIIQAVLGERDILVCDESFAPLDPVAQVAVRELLRAEARRGAAVLVSSHQLDQLPKFADAVVILAGGMIVRHLDATELRTGAVERDASLEQIFLAAIASRESPPGTA